MHFKGVASERVGFSKSYGIESVLPAWDILPIYYVYSLLLSSYFSNPLVYSLFLVTSFLERLYRVVFIRKKKHND